MMGDNDSTDLKKLQTPRNKNKERTTNVWRGRRRHRADERAGERDRERESEQMQSERDIISNNAYENPREQSGNSHIITLISIVTQ